MFTFKINVQIPYNSKPFPRCIIRTKNSVPLLDHTRICIIHRHIEYDNTLAPPLNGGQEFWNHRRVYIVKKKKKTKAMRIEIACVAGVIVL